MRMTIRDLGYTPGKLPPGPQNSILDVEGVHVGQNTVTEGGNDVRKGVTVIFPRPPQDIQKPCYAAIHTLNGNGEVTGYYQIQDWGYTNTPIALTNSTSLGEAYSALWQWTLSQAKQHSHSEKHMSLNYGTPIVGETADWMLNDVFRSALDKNDVHAAIEAASAQKEVLEGQHGGGAGMTCHLFAGGTGTASRVVKGGEGGEEYTVGVLVQTNYGNKPDLQIGGVPVGRLLVEEQTQEQTVVAERPGRVGEGSIVVLFITSAPLLPHQLKRVAQRCGVGLAQVGGHGIARNYSGDIFLALSTGSHPDEHLVTPNAKRAIPPVEAYQVQTIRNESMDTMFQAASECTEEAILNSMVGGRDGREGFKGIKIDGLPVEKVKELLSRYSVK